MSLIVFDQANMAGGVTRQPVHQRARGTAKAQDNCFASHQRGVGTRHPHQHRRRLTLGLADYSGPVLTHVIDRGPTEQYEVVAQTRYLSVVNLLTGERHPVVTQGGTAAETAFTYLEPQKTSADDSRIIDLKTPIDLSDNQATIEDPLTGVNVTDSWKMNATVSAGTVTPSYSGVGVVNPGPFGGAFSAQTLRVVKNALGAGVADFYYRFVQADEGGTTALWNKFAETGRWNENTIHVKQGVANPTPNVTVGFLNATDAIRHTATFDFAGSGTVLTLTPSSTTGSVTALATHLGNGEYRISTWHRSAVGESTKQRRLLISFTIGAAEALTRDLIVCGAMLAEREDAAVTDRWWKPYENLRFLTIQDYTFIVNRATTVTMDTTAAAVASPVAEAYLWMRRAGNLATVGTRITQAAGSIKAAALCVRDQTNNTAPFNICMLSKTWPAGGGAKTKLACEGAAAGAPNTTSAALGVWIAAAQGILVEPNTDILAQHLAFAKDGNTDEWQWGIDPRWVALNAANTTECKNGVIRLTSPNAITALEVEDSFGGDGLVKIHGSVARTTDLPETGPIQDGFRIRVKGDNDPEEKLDDIFLRFTADTAGTFNKGKWIQSTDYGTLTRLKATTMPHQLVRKNDDAAGTVTGKPYGIYFEYGPLKQVGTGDSWDDRIVGDDTLNKRPTFVGTKILELKFWQGRLGFYTAQTIVLSDSKDYFNFWRTTTLRQIASDRLDLNLDKTNGYPVVSAATLNNSLIYSDKKTINAFVAGDRGADLEDIHRAEYLTMENSDVAPPVKMLRSLMFAEVNGQSSSIREVFPSDDGLSAQSADLLSHALGYIEGDFVQIAASPLAKCVVGFTYSNPRYLYVLRLEDSGGQRVQQAVWRYDAGAMGAFRGVGWTGSTLYMTVQREKGWHLEYAVVIPGVKDSTGWLCFLDRRCSEDTPGFSKAFGGGFTTITLPYQLDTGETAVVVNQATGDPYTVVNPSTTTVGSLTVSTVQVATSDLTAVPLWVGIAYLAKWTANAPMIYDDKGGGAVARADGSTKVVSAVVCYDDTHHLKFTAALRGISQFDDEITIPCSYDDASDVTAPTFGTGQWPVTVAGEAYQLEVALESSDHRGFNVSKIEFQVDYVGDGQRASG